MSIESGLRHDARNGDAAFGYIQLTKGANLDGVLVWPDAISGLDVGIVYANACGGFDSLDGFKTLPQLESILSMSDEEQLSKVVEPYYRRLGKLEGLSPGDLYLKNFTPAFSGKPDDFVIYDIDTPNWKSNPGLRSSGNGPITAGSVRAVAMRVWSGARGRVEIRCDGSESPAVASKSPTPERPMGRKHFAAGTVAVVAAVTVALIASSKGTNHAR